MATRTSRFDEGRANATRIRVSIGNDIWAARVGAGMSLRDAGGRAGVSHTQFRRIELGRLPRVSVDALSVACSSVGLKMIARAIPGAGPAIDAAQLALIGRFRAVLPSETPFWTEVPLPIPGDLRAWDAMFRLGVERVGVEAETRLGDFQSLDRRCQLKLRDSGLDLMLLLVNDTAHNREVLASSREALRPTFPLDGRHILRALRAGKAPTSSGIVVL